MALQRESDLLIWPHHLIHPLQNQYDTLRPISSFLNPVIMLEIGPMAWPRSPHPLCPSHPLLFSAPCCATAKLMCDVACRQHPVPSALNMHGFSCQPHCRGNNKRALLQCASAFSVPPTLLPIRVILPPILHDNFPNSSLPLWEDVALF